MGKPLREADKLVDEISHLIEASRQYVSGLVNHTLTLMYWQIGRRINHELLKNARAEYGKQIVVSLSRQLSDKYGVSFEEKNLRRMMQFATVFEEEKNVVSVTRQLSWAHFIALIPLKDGLKRQFYTEICVQEKWSVRQLRERIKSMLYERTAISKAPESTIRKELEQLREEGVITPELVFRDPYFLDFLGLKDTYSEKDLESSILAELQRFIIELGNDFAFMARQKRITVDNRDYFIDLLFYHRRLKCLVVIDLKLGEFEAAHKGQMELYLRYLEKFENVEGENTPIGLILCAGKNEEHIELLQLHKSNIKVSEYLTKLPPKRVLQEKLHKAIAIAQQKLIQRDSDNQTEGNL
jgi:predicted nuclease of restriction endonuclease-like (RecB) superfamily